ncbi:MAG TPA: leucyl/phenylalanyl-tRNA--protein transferase [Ignavibacteria bacterium]|jgi:leucyl/phenylalanyl-tRNA--protein transferase
MENPTYKYYELTWQQVLYGYSIGIFPMGTEEDNSISWFEANPRAIMPIELPPITINIPRSLKQIIKKNIFNVTVDKSFVEVLDACANRPDTWINDTIKKVYVDLFKKGYAHSIEVWKNENIAGGLYGVAYKGAFFGESMFRRENNASKVAVVELYEILKKNKFILLDIQMMTPHFKTFGAIEVSKRVYSEILERAMEVNRKFEL